MNLRILSPPSPVEGGREIYMRREAEKFSQFDESRMNVASLIHKHLLSMDRWARMALVLGSVCFQGNFMTEG